MAGFRHLGDREVAAGYRIRLVRATFEAPDGSTFERDVVRDKRVVAVVPLLDDARHVLLVRQYRGPVDREMLEISAGLCDVEGEDDPEVTAVLVLTEWDEFRSADFAKIQDSMHQPAFVFDGRNVLDRQALEAAGFEYHGIGKS